MKKIISMLLPIYQMVNGRKGNTPLKKNARKESWNPFHQKRSTNVKGSRSIPAGNSIESRSLDLLGSYRADTGREVGSYIDPIDILEYLGYGIDYVKDKYPSGGPNAVYGAVDTENKIVEINDDVSFNEGMENFTVAHEIGHIILHSDEKDQNRSEKTCIMNDSDDRVEKELEADRFSACLLMPTGEVTKAFNSVRSKPLNLKKMSFFGIIKKRSRRKSAIVFSEKVITAGGFTNVSKLAMVNRLIGMGLIKGLHYQKNVEKATKRS